MLSFLKRLVPSSTPLLIGALIGTMIGVGGMLAQPTPCNQGLFSNVGVAHAAAICPTGSTQIFSGTIGIQSGSTFTATVDLSTNPTADYTITVPTDGSTADSFGMLGQAGTWTADQTFNDNVNRTYGTGGDAGIDYDGTNLVVDPDVVGSGFVDVQGDLRVTNGQGVVVGNATQVAVGLGTSEHQVLGTGDADGSALLGRWSADAGAPTLAIVKSRNAAIGSNTIVQSGDEVFSLTGFADDGTDFASQVAKIVYVIDGTPGVDDTPGRIGLYTTADGAATATERWRVTSAGVLRANGAQTISSTAALTIDPTTTLTITLTDDTPAAYVKANSAANYYTMDTRNTVGPVNVHFWDTEDATIASAAGAAYRLAFFNAYVLNYTGTTQVTSLVSNVTLGAPTLTDGSALTVDKATNIEVSAPIEGGSVTLAESSAIRILDSGSGSPTNQIGLYIESLTSGGTDYAIFAAGTPIIHASLPAAAPATNISLDGSNNFQQDTSSIRWKDNVADLIGWRDVLAGLRPVEFDWEEGVGVDGLRLAGDGRRDFGFIAEEAAGVDLRVATFNLDGSVQSVRYQLLTAHLVAGWQEHDNRIADLERELLVIKAELRRN